MKLRTILYWKKHLKKGNKMITFIPTIVYLSEESFYGEKKKYAISFVFLFVEILILLEYETR